MDNRTEANINQLAKDAHFVTAPIRLLRRLLATALIILLFPALCAALFLALPAMSEDEVWLMKVAFGVLGPFVVGGFWFPLMVHWLQRMDSETPPWYAKDGGFTLGITGFMLSAAGSLWAASDGAGVIALFLGDDSKVVPLYCAFHIAVEDFFLDGLHINFTNLYFLEALFLIWSPVLLVLLVKHLGGQLNA
jgi:hypothetical protein